MWFEMCGSCGKEYGEYEIKNGSLCGHCFGRLPKSVQKSCKNFTKKELHCLNKQIAEPDIWEEIGMLGIGRSMLSIGGKGIWLKNVKRISLNFHPLKEGRHSGTVMGKVTVIAEMCHPHIVIEEPLLREDMTVFYHISSGRITYKYSRWLEALVGMLQECLEKRICDMTPYREKVSSFIREYNREKAEEEAERRADKARKKAEEAKRAEEARRRAEEAKRKEEARKKAYEEQKNKADRAGRNEALQNAMKLFQVQNGYTRSELKERRRKLMKKHHPDAGGSEEMAKKINSAYDLLDRCMGS